MSLPKKKNLSPHLNKVGKERVQEIVNIEHNDTDYLPKGILLEDLDDAMFTDFLKEKVNLVIEGEEIPCIFMTKEKWADFSFTWQLNDEKGNVVMPFITLRRVSSPRLGNNSQFRSRIPQNKNFNYYKVPTMYDGILGLDIYKVPQPTQIELDYEIRFFTKYITDVNSFNEKILEMFNSFQVYINKNGHYIQLSKNDSTDQNTVNDFNEHNHYVEIINITLNGFILNPDSFEVVRSVRNINLNI